MSELATLLQAIAALLWPAFAFTALFVFRKQIADLARRVKKGKVFQEDFKRVTSLQVLEEDSHWYARAQEDGSPQ